MAIAPITRGTTRTMSVEIEAVEGVIPNIILDKVTLIVKINIDDADASAVLEVDADVSTSGDEGIALFNLSKTDTDFAPGSYFYDVIWYLLTGEEYPLDVGVLEIVARVSDV